MKPSKTQYFFAADWPAKLWLASVPLLFAVWAGISYPPTLESFRDWPTALLFFGIVVLGLLLGFFLAILGGWFLLGPLYYNRSVENGEPFHEGDMVQILVGKYRDRVFRVSKAGDMAPWAGAHRIVVDLGEATRADKENVFKSY
jgi:hypothetical protein